MAQKQNPKKALLCTYRNCKNLQTGEGEFCSKHYSRKKVGIIKECEKFDKKEVKLIRAYAIILKDEHGQAIYTFDNETKANLFYLELKRNRKINE